MSIYNKINRYCRLKFIYFKRFLNFYNDEIIETIQFAINESFKTVMQTIVYLIIIFIMPLFILMIGSMLSEILYQLLVFNIPSLKANQVITTSLPYILSGFIWGIIIYLFHAIVKIDFDELGMYKGIVSRSKMAIFIKTIIFPILLGIFIDLYFPNINFEQSLLFIDKTTKFISPILKTFNLEYLNFILPMIPSAIIGFFAIKYFIYSIITFFFPIDFLIYSIYHYSTLKI